MGEIGKTNFKIHSDKFPGIYRGLVMDNVDPLQYGRVKVQIYPMLADVETTNLPWAVPMYPIWEGSGTGIGYFAVPDIGTMVFVMFEQGDVYQPVYIGEAPDAVKGLPSDRTTSYPNRKVLKTSSGVIIWVDDTTKQIKITHPMGSCVWFNTEGFITLYAVGNIKLDTSIVKVTGNMDIDTGWTGTFTTSDGKTVTVSTGIITNVE